MSRWGCWKPRVVGNNGGKKWLANAENPNWAKYIDYCTGSLTSSRRQFVNTVVLPPEEGSDDPQCTDTPCRELSDLKWIDSAGELVASGNCGWVEDSPGIYDPGAGHMTNTNSGQRAWVYTTLPTWTPATGTWTCENTKATRAQRTTWNCGEGQWGTMQDNRKRLATDTFLDDEGGNKYYLSNEDLCMGGGGNASDGFCDCNGTYAFNKIANNWGMDGATTSSKFSIIECPHTNNEPGLWYTSDYCGTGEESCRRAAEAAVPRRYKDSQGNVYDGPGFEYSDPNDDSSYWPVEGPYSELTDVRFTEYYWKNFTVNHVMSPPADYDVEDSDGTYWILRNSGVQGDGTAVISTGDMTDSNGGTISSGSKGEVLIGNDGSVTLMFGTQMANFDNATDASVNAGWAESVMGVLSAWEVDEPQLFEMSASTGSLSQSTSMGPIYKYGDDAVLLDNMDTEAVGSLSITDATEAGWRSNSYTNSVAVPLQGWPDSNNYTNTMMYDRSDWTSTAFVYQHGDTLHEENIQEWMDDNCYETDGTTLKPEYADADETCDVCDDPEFPGNEE